MNFLKNKNIFNAIIEKRSHIVKGCKNGASKYIINHLKPAINHTMGLKNNGIISIIIIKINIDIINL